MAWILLMMLGMILGSIVVELVLPARLKQALGGVICWMMMAVTMGGLAAATVGLIAVVVWQFVLPLT